MLFNVHIEDIKYLKILYKDTKGNSCIAKAAIKKVNEREIVSCVKYEENMSAQTPQECTLSIICQDGLYRTKTKLKTVDFDLPYVFFIFEIPKGLEYQQNREYFRVDAQYSCHYIADNKEFYTETSNISANGISIIVPEHIISETDSTIEILINDRSIKTGVRYIRSELTEDNLYKLSFTYTNISESDRDYISKACIKKQLEDKRHHYI